MPIEHKAVIWMKGWFESDELGGEECLCDREEDSPGKIEILKCLLFFRISIQNVRSGILPSDSMRTSWLFGGIKTRREKGIIQINSEIDGSLRNRI
jgi:hypothetical protein